MKHVFASLPWVTEGMETLFNVNFDKLYFDIPMLFVGLSEEMAASLKYLKIDICFFENKAFKLQ